jgi:leader peptidase (prepilin peptidase)/N-methyltransferase
MDISLLVLAAILGLSVGSFLNVVVYRVPQGLSVGGRSHCPHCNYQLSPLDNIPVLSWIVLRARCRKCASPIALQYPMVEAFTGIGYVIFVGAFGISWLLPVMLIFFSASVALLVIDLKTLRLPDRITLPLFATLLTGLLMATGLGQDSSALVRALVGSALLTTGYAAIWVLTAGKGFGLGDVKLALSLGLVTAYVGWGALIVATATAWMSGAIIGIALLAARRVGRRSPIPFGPFLIAGAWVGLLFGESWFSAYWDFMVAL